MPAPRSGSFASPVDGLTLTTWTWDDVPGQPLGVVQLVHGLAEHSPRYGRLATALNAAGFLITGADSRGHGASVSTEVPLGSFGAAGVAGFLGDIVAAGEQLGRVGTGNGTHDQIWHTYGIIKRFIPAEVPAMRKARQQHGKLDFSLINRVHVPIAHYSLLFLVVLLAAALARSRFDAQTQLAATVVVAIVANAFACGVLSGPHDRYGARMAWLATAVVLIAAIRLFTARSAARDRLTAAVTGSR